MINQVLLCLLGCDCEDGLISKGTLIITEIIEAVLEYISFRNNFVLFTRTPSMMTKNDDF